VVEGKEKSQRKRSVGGGIAARVEQRKNMEAGAVCFSLFTKRKNGVTRR